MTILTKDTREGEAFAGKPKVVSWERIWAFSGGPFNNRDWPEKNIHTDLEFAKGCGLPHVAATGVQHMGYLVQLMIDLFGAEWLWHGTIDVKFISIVSAGDTLVAKAVIKSKEAQDSATKFTLEVCCENQRGQKVLVGFATGMIGAVGFSKIRADAPLPGTAGQLGVEGGQSLEPLEYVVTPELNQQYLYAEEDFHPRYLEETESGPPLAHPAQIIHWSNAPRSPSYIRGTTQDDLAAREETFFLKPARVGQKLKVTWKTLGSYEKRGRPYLIEERLVMDEDGAVIIRRRTHRTIASQQYKKEYEK